MKIQDFKLYYTIYAILESVVYTEFFYLSKDHSIKTNIRKCARVLNVLIKKPLDHHFIL